MACRDCGEIETRASLGGVELCDRCADRRTAEITGLPRLPEPPPAIVLTGPDGRRHRLRFRIWRAPTGIEVELEESEVPPGEGYHVAVLGDHNADIAELVGRARQRAETAIAAQYLESARHRPGWVLKDEQARGRFLWNDARSRGTPYDVVVDGRTLSWEELGEALEAFEGWAFHLVIEERVEDARDHGASRPLDLPDTIR